jgi:hypothetical protein
MVMSWCKALARTILGRPRTEAPPEQPHSWRGKPLAPGSTAPPRPHAYRTLAIEDVPDNPANGPTTGSSPIPPTPDAPGADALP